ncbi:MAG: hypothetical protein ACOX55_08880 [Christensenellales bacterium]
MTAKEEYPLLQPETPWEERFGWYHYDGQHVYQYTEEDLNHDAQRYADTGITTIILFGAHFRFSFWAYWADIEDFIARLTRAFHAKGIKVIEHHSTHLTYQPVCPDSFWSEENPLYKKLSSFPNFRETSQSNPILGGAHLDDFAQMDGSTGKPCLSSYIHTEGKDLEWIFKHYNGNAHCFNHPAFEKSYWEHIQNIIAKAHIDGIMNDDVQWFGGGNACACKYCREKFEAETGHILPLPDEWSEFFENYDRLDYIAWKQFKKRQSGAFHYRMDERYRSIGFAPMRPAYCAEVLPFDTTCYGFEPARALWDYIFQECCCLISHSYICYAAEAIHRFAMASRLGKPSMALFYPATADSTYAAWAMCRSWGQLFTGTSGNVKKLFDKPYRDFERKHKALFRNPQKRADVAFYFSETTRDYTHKDAPQKYMKPYMSYLESAYISGIACDMVFRYDTVTELAKQRCIIVPYIIMISDAEAKKLFEYASNGGHVVILGPFAEKQEDGTMRSLADRLSLVGMKSSLREAHYQGPEVIHGITFADAQSHVLFDKVMGQAIAYGEEGQVLAVQEAVGKGFITYHPADISNHPVQPAVWPRGQRTPVDRSYVAEMRSGNGKLLKILTGETFLTCSREDMMVSLYETDGGTALHLLNVAGLLPANDTDASVSDQIHVYHPSSEKIQESFTVLIRSLGRMPSKTVLFSPELPSEVEIGFAQEKGTLQLTIPGGLFSGYALVHIQ